MEVERLPNQKTACTPGEMLHALSAAWVQLFQETARIDSLCVLTAQWAHETGWGKACYGWNIGNFKSIEGDGRNFTYRVCWENVNLASAEAAVAKAAWRSDNPSKRTVVIESRSGDTAKVWFYPDHPASRFRAYPTLVEGTIDYLASLKKRFSKSWPAVLAGDPASFAKLLKDQGYYTDTVANYSRALMSHFSVAKRVPFEPEKAPLFNDAEKMQLLALAALTAIEATRDDVLHPHEIDIPVEDDDAPPTDPEPVVA